MRKAFDTEISQAENGVVVKIGCQLFVGRAENLVALAAYFAGKLPTFVSGIVKEEEAFLDEDCPVADEGCEGNTEGRLNRSIHRKIEGSPSYKVFAARNGYVLVMGGKAYVALSKTELVHLLPGFTEMRKACQSDIDSDDDYPESCRVDDEPECITEEQTYPDITPDKEVLTVITTPGDSSS